VVERLLRRKFENDDTLHAEQRRACELVRAALLAAKAKGATAERLCAQLQRANSNAITEVTWQLTARPTDNNKPLTDELEIKKRFGPEAQLLSAPHASEGLEQKHYFEDLPGELQNVLRVQLRQAGDVSAVIETPGGFLLYLAIAKSEQAMTVASLSLPKRSYADWLNEQKDTP
jgi:hypothetical protein